MNTTHITPDKARRIRQAIAECNDFIAKEGARSADLRPADMTQHLEFCHQHRAKLLAMLNNEAQ